MLKNKLKELLIFVFRRLKLLLRPWPRFRRFINTWPKLIGSLALAFVLLYYPLGALISENIDTNTEYEIVKRSNASATIDTMSFLIRRELYTKSWTPALPFFFPAAILDNMPAFQLGLMRPISRTIQLLSAKMDKSTAEADKSPLLVAAELLQYPGTIWMFSTDNKLVPAPSSNSQYRRARKQLDKYNNMLANGQALFKTSPQNLAYILSGIKKDMAKSDRRLETQIREYSSSFYDGKADDVFYYQQGQMYSYFLLLKALSHDFKSTIVDNGIYQSWTSLLKSLEDAAHLSPLIIRNAELGASFSPNHLAIIGYYNRKAMLAIQSMLNTLKDSTK